MSDDERIERLKLEVEVLQANNKGLRDKIEELKREKAIYYYEWKHLEANVINQIKAKIEEVSNGTYDAKIVLQSLLEKE